MHKISFEEELERKRHLHHPDQRGFKRSHQICAILPDAQVNAQVQVVFLFTFSWSSR